MKISKMKVMGLLCLVSFAVEGITSQKANSKDIMLKKLQKKLLNTIKQVYGFDASILRIIKEGAEQLAGDNERFKKLIMTTDSDRLTILSHLVLEHDPSALFETINTINNFFGVDYKPIAYLFRKRDKWGRSPLYFAALRKKNDMIEVLLHRAKIIFGHDKGEFLSFINGENKKGHREKLNYRTPFILASYNDDEKSVAALLQMALRVLGKETKNFKEFLHARDLHGATAAFYASNGTKTTVKKFGIVFDGSNE